MVWIAFIFLAVNTAVLRAQVTFPEYQGWVNDFAEVIPEEAETNIHTLAFEVKQKTGADIAAVSVKNMQGMDVSEYTVRLFKDWGIGEKDKDNGVLLFLAMQERKVRIEVGYGLEGILPDGLCGEILDKYVIPDFRNGDYGMGFYRGMTAIAGVIARDAGVTITGAVEIETEEPRPAGLFFVMFVIFLIIITKGRIIPWLLMGMLSGGSGGKGGPRGFGGGGFGGRGFGGFGGGSSGGGGASRGF